jgi:hypothetical protein
MRSNGTELKPAVRGVTAWNQAFENLWRGQAGEGVVPLEEEVEEGAAGEEERRHAAGDLPVQGEAQGP